MNLLKVDVKPNDFKEEISRLGLANEIGIYKLLFFENGVPRIIHRLFAKDESGTLYIGMTESPFLGRVSKLHHALYSNSYREKISKPSHSGHTQMGKKYFRIRNKVRIEDLYIQIIPHESPKKEESDALEEYVREFGELPPLNGQYGHFDPDWQMF